VTIGIQIWMKENLKTVHYSNGVAIPNVTANNSWAALTSGAYCDNDNLTTNGIKYGHLYSFYTVVDTRHICPTGWHIPSLDEWNTLENTLGVESEGGKLKTTTNDWRQPNIGATNSSGFSALPGGNRDATGNYTPTGSSAKFWGKTYFSESSCYRMELHDNVEYAMIRASPIEEGCNIRCLKDDNATSINIANKTFDIAFYPNPATDKLYIKNSKSSNAQIIIFNLQGKQVLNRKIGSNPIDISNLSKGVYLVKIIDSGNIIMEKLIKE